MPSLVDRLVTALIFQPTRGVDLTPAELGVAGEEVWIDTEDGVRIHGFWLPGDAEPARAILFFHGNAGNASWRLPNAAELVRLGAHVLLLDYRGYGRSEGTPSEEGLYADARAGLRHLTGERGIPESRVVVFGRSLGGAVAVDLARDRPLAGVILESTFTSVRDIAATMVGPPGRWLAGDSFDSASKIDALRAPLLSLHGDRDRIIRPRLGRRLFEAAPGPKEFDTIAGAGHNDVVAVGGAPYFARIGRFLEAVAPLREPTPAG
ncbi:MAG: alpha/beta hydrolase [Myxococcota bacterium]